MLHHWRNHALSAELEPGSCMAHDDLDPKDRMQYLHSGEVWQTVFFFFFFSCHTTKFCHIKQIFGDCTEQLTKPKSLVSYLQCWRSQTGNPVTSKLKHCRQWDQYTAASFNKLCCYSHTLPQSDVRIPTALYELFNTDYCLTTYFGDVMGVYKVSGNTSSLWAMASTCATHPWAGCG